MGNIETIDFANFHFHVGAVSESVEIMTHFLDPVLERYPKKASDIRERALKDPLFNSACQDFCEAHQALQRWQASGSPNSQDRIAEFSRIISELEAEIETILGQKDRWSPSRY